MSGSEKAYGPLLSYRDLEYVPDDGNRYEVIDGVLYVTPFPGYAHQNVVGELHRILAPFVHEHRLGKVFPPGLKVVLDELTGVGPDLTYVSIAQMHRMQDDGFYGVPDLAVEVISSKPQLDRIIKRQKYASGGIPHYWLIDPSTRNFQELVLAGSQYRLSVEKTGNEKIQPKLFPGLEIDLSELWC